MKVFIGMKKIHRLSEGDIQRIVNLVLEQDNPDWEEYDEMDYMDVFFRAFGNWLKETKQINPPDYPVSYLLKKYAPEFLLVNDLEEREYVEDEDFEIPRWSMIDYGKKILKKGVFKYPSMREEGTFMEKFGNAIKRFESSQKYPPYVNLIIDEKKPYELHPILKINLLEFLKDPDNRMFSKSKLREELEKFIQAYLGMDIGSITHGGVHIHQPDYLLEGEDEFVKKIFGKEIKKRIKENTNIIQRMRLEITDGPRLSMYLTFKSDSNYYDRKIVADDAAEILKGMGYNPTKLKVFK